MKNRGIHIFPKGISKIKKPCPGFEPWSMIPFPMINVMLSMRAYISNNQSASLDRGCGLFANRIYEEFHINLWSTRCMAIVTYLFPSRMEI